MNTFRTAGDGHAHAHTRVMVFALALALALGLSPAHAQSHYGQPGTYVIRNATITIAPGRVMENGTVVIMDGRITAVGTRVTEPANATVIDATGKRVYAGMIDSHTSLGITEIGSVPAMEDVQELGDINPHMRAIVAVNPSNEIIPVSRVNGITSVITAPEGGLLSGQAALMHLDGWTWEDMAIKPTAAFVINYPRAGGGFGGFFGGTPSPDAQRAAELRVAREVDQLKAFLAQGRGYAQARAGGATDTDLAFESLRALFDGTVPALISANTEEQIEGALALADSFGIRPIILGGDQAWRIAGELARRNVPVILGSTMSVPANDEPYDAAYANAAALHRAGVKFAFSTGGAANVRHLPYHAALAVAYGLPAEAAWRALTVAPAEIWGVADRLGTLEAGKSADLFITSGDPLDIRSVVSEVFIEGKRIPMDDRHTRLYELWRSRPAPTE